MILRAAPLHNGSLPSATKLISRALISLLPSVTADKSDHAPVKNNNTLTVNNKVFKPLNVGCKARIHNPHIENWLQKGKDI